MSAYVQQSSMVSGRSMVLVVTVALHAAAISALLAWKITEANSPGTIRDLVVTIRPDRPRSAPRPEASNNPLVGIPMPMPKVPVTPIDVETTDTSLVAQIGTPEPQAGTADPQVPVPVVVEQTPLRFQAVRPSDDYYPPMAIRLEQQGSVIVRACADATGRLSGRPDVVTGSRYRLLDEAAVKWAAEALRFTPATRDGAAIAACKEFRVNFTLH